MGTFRRSIGPGLLFFVAGALAQAQPAGDSWPHYRGDFAGTGYSTLGQIDASNVGGLALAWQYSLRSEATDARDPNSQATPIVVSNVMYLPAADRILALDPVTGAELWQHLVEGDAPSRRGLAFWPGNDTTAPRLFYVRGNQLVAINAGSGVLSRDFGNDGVVDLGVPYNSVPLVVEDTLIVGANTPRGASGGIGNPRAFHARTGAKLWEFSAVAQPGEPGHDTWAEGSWENRLGANAWPFYFTVDPERDLLFLPLAAPLPFPWGGDRAGANLYANSIVAVDVHTGAYRWHFQTIHHDLWDHDPPAPPTLFELPAGNGRPAATPALAVTTKSGYLYLLNRETGEPIYPVAERPVPVSDVPGEVSFPTQPIPTLIPPMSRTAFRREDLVTAADTSAAHVSACEQLLAAQGEVVNQGPFTPWVYRAADGPPRTTLLFPGLAGGPNWGGAAHDPNTGYVFVFAQDLGSFGWLEDAPADAGTPYVLRGPRPSGFDVAMGEARWPCQKPPWGRVTAIDTATGAVAWVRPVGITEGLPVDKQNTGRPGRAGAIVTAGGVLFIAATDDGRFRALDVRTGDTLWETDLGRQGNANPMTYLGSDGRQYVAIVAGDSVQVFRGP